jgi:carbonic anhydrase
VSVTNELLANNARYTETFNGTLPFSPAEHAAVVACMDARLDVYRILGLREGEAHVIRDAGGVVIDDQFPKSIQDDTGIKPAWPAEAFPDLDEDVRQSIARIKASPFVPNKDSIRGFVFDVANGTLHEVQAHRHSPDVATSSLLGRLARRLVRRLGA